MKRENTREVSLGKIKVGGKNPIWVEAMGRESPAKVKESIEEIEKVIEEDCEIFRLAVPDEESLLGLLEIKRRIDIPLIADVHFNLDLGIKAAQLGIDAVRVNPGTAGNKKKLGELIKILQDKNLALRIGANTGSLPLHYRGKNRVEALFGSLEELVSIPEKNNFKNIILSAKSTDVEETIIIYEKLSRAFPYPLHVGLTEAGEGGEGIVKSSIALGIILREGIGNNIRVSLTATDPVLETRVAWSILEVLKLRSKGLEIISCPTCARRKGDVVALTRDFKQKVRERKIKIVGKVAIMGCEVNGPGEAKEADWGLAFAPQEKALLFSRGERIKIVRQEEAEEELISLIIKEMEEKGP
ncbi:MAG TPA: flavodoxin-dependent (E)-4-hydroxy-3-methylbut-2-enyl-diphosphate synthase [Candidatus Atribacteria bacterium]|nr:flavodoxin-dependent (E)-4-hydroxy-3-methylbut-2-enyl-diphosphate synthase [Candidatus Atribacteria bacterium]